MPRLMPRLRAIAANLVFYINIIVWMLLGLPLFLLPRRATIAAMKAWALSSIWLIRMVTGIRWEIRGLENIPRNTDGTMQGCIIAAKHQSMWETFGLLPYLDDPAYILKKELIGIPFFGWYGAKAGMIAVDRKKGASALRDMTRNAKQAVDENRQLIIFPEGTRQAVGAKPDYKSGVAHMYKQLDVPLVPAALNSGVFWPRRQGKRYPGLLVIALQPVIAPGADPRTMTVELQTSIEAQTDALVDEAQKTLSG